METIYVDSLVLFNALIDYFLLLAAGKLCSAPLRRLRLALAALLGGVYSLACVLWPDIFALPAAKIGSAVLLVLIGYGTRSLPRLCLAFCGAAAAFGGTIYALAGLTGALGSDGIYLPVSMKTLILSFAICYFLVSLVFRRVGARCERQIEQLTVSLGGRSVNLRALRDTGNGLTDPVSQRPVLIAECGALAPLFSEAAEDCLRCEDAAAALERLSALGETRGSPRLIPYSSLGRSGALLLCFTPDSVEPDDSGGVRAVAVSPVSLSPDGDYNALI